MARMSEDLPAPFAPTSATSSAARDLQRDAGERLRVAVEQIEFAHREHQSRAVRPRPGSTRARPGRARSRPARRARSPRRGAARRSDRRAPSPRASRARSAGWSRPRRAARRAAPRPARRSRSAAARPSPRRAAAATGASRARARPPGAGDRRSVSARRGSDAFSARPRRSSTAGARARAPATVRSLCSAPTITLSRTRQPRERLDELKRAADAGRAHPVGRQARDRARRAAGSSPRSGRCTPGDQVEDRRLAGAVRTDERDDRLRSTAKLAPDTARRPRNDLLDVFDLQSSATSELPRLEAERARERRPDAVRQVDGRRAAARTP